MFFIASKEGEKDVWWFGGGMDLTPIIRKKKMWCIGTACFDVCQPFGDEVYPRFKKWCDDYFYLKHRDETRGVGGLFFDDLNEWGFDKSFAFMQAVELLQAYIRFEKRKNAVTTDIHVSFSCIDVDVMWSLTWFLTEALYLACKREDVRSLFDVVTAACKLGI